MCHKPVCCVLQNCIVYAVMLCIIGLYVVSQSCISVCYMFHSQTCMYTCMLHDSKTCHTCRPVCCVLTVTPTDLYVVSQTCMLHANCHIHRPVLCVSYQCHRFVCCVSTVTLSVSQTCMLCVNCHIISVTDLYLVCLRPVCCVTIPVLHLSQTNNSVCCVVDL